MLFFMQDFENLLQAGAMWRCTTPILQRGRNGEGTEAPHSTIHEVIGISILHFAARYFHQDGLGTIRILVEPSSRSPAIRVSSSTQVEQVALCPSNRLLRCSYRLTNSSASVHQIFASLFSLSAPRSDTNLLIFAADQPVSPPRRCRVKRQPIGRLQS